MSISQQLTQHCFHTLDSVQMYQLLEQVKDKLESMSFDRLVSVDLLPLSLTSLLSVSVNKPFIITRKQTKGYGTNKSIEGSFSSGEKVVVLVFDFDQAAEDVLLMLQDSGLIIQKVLVFNETVFNQSNSYNIESIE